MEENKSYPTPEQLDSQFKFITYLIGSMEFCAEKDDGTEKRAGVEKELLLRNVYPINPVKLESSKTGMTTEEVKNKMCGWLASGNWELFKTRAIEIWKGKKFIDGKGELVHLPGDIAYCTMSNWITFTYNKGDKPCLVGNTRILMDDLSVKNIEDIRIGDKVKGFVKENGVTKMVTTEVYGKYLKGIKDTLRITDDKGNTITCTPDHKFLTRNKKKGSIYSEISKIEDIFSIQIQQETPIYLNSYIISKSKNGMKEVYDITTSTGNFVAEGFIVHNCGSFAECGIALEHDIPIYLITDMPKKELPKSLLQMILVTDGEVFNSLFDYLNFVDQKYKLKRKEPKIEEIKEKR
jgi:hypothetical protein